MITDETLTSRKRQLQLIRLHVVQGRHCPTQNVVQERDEAESWNQKPAIIELENKAF